MKFADATFGGLSIGGTGNMLDAKFANGSGTVNISGASGTLAVDAGSLSGFSVSSGSLASTIAAAIASGNVALTTNTGTTSLTGKLTLSGFSATGGGTVSTTAAGNTIAGTLTVDGTKLGTDNLTFASVTGSGITLNQTGSAGHLAVNGGTVGSIALTDTQSPAFAQVHVTAGITGSSVRSFSLDGSTVSGTSRFDNLSGSAAVTNSTLSGGYDNLRVVNSTGTLNRLTVSNTTIGATTGNDGINVESTLGGDATMNVTVDHTTFTNAVGDLFEAVVDGSGGGDVVFTNNTLSNNNAAIGSGVGGVSLEGARGGTTTFTVTGNTMRDAVGNALQLVHGQGSNTLNATITGNTIGVAGAANSGSLEGQGITIEHNGGGGTLNATVANNQVRQYNGEGIRVLAGGGVVESGAFNVDLTGNTVTEPGANGAISAPHYGLLLNNGTQAGDTFATCLNIGQANAFSSSGRNGGGTFRLRQRQNTTVKLAGYAGGATDTNAVNAYVASLLGGTGTSAFDQQRLRHGRDLHPRELKRWLNHFSPRSG